MIETDRIRVLSGNVANKIAAGEVVDRPASVVKELVENALDAGASEINVEVAAGGRKLVSVSDSGKGMSRDDAILALERHATSKITDVDDIEKIATLGFRGEALPAIASVSRFRMVTRVKDEAEGTEISVSGGKMLDVRPAGAPTGTLIEVRDLFFNVPARRKFLRSVQTETSHIKDVFISQSLSHPSVAMSLKLEGRVTYRLAPGKAEDRIRDLFGADYIKSLTPVDFSGNEMRVRGFAGLPSTARLDRSEQFIFINGRVSGAPVLSFAVKEAYRTLVADAKHPALFLFCEINPELVDVNVHPAKKEVRFRNTSDVRDLFIGALRKALGNPMGITLQSQFPGVEPSVVAIRTADALKIDDLPRLNSFNYSGLSGVGGQLPLQPESKPSAQGSVLDMTDDSEKGPWDWCRVLGQIGGLYVLLETSDGYVVMDPHAAHERVLFEKFLRAFEQGKINSQNLLIPETVKLTEADMRILLKNLDVFESLGFGVAEFGGNTLVVDAVPAFLGTVSLEPMFMELVYSLAVSGPKNVKSRMRQEAVARAACKAAVKAKDRLSVAEIEQLVIDLAKAEMPYTCPHGRPTIIFTSFTELNRKFARE